MLRDPWESVSMFEMKPIKTKAVKKNKKGKVCAQIPRKLFLISGTRQEQQRPLIDIS